MSNIAITVPTNEIAAVTKWAASSDERPHLTLVVWRNGEYVACDGQRLVRVPCGTGTLAFGVARRYLLAAVAAQRDLRPSGERELKLIPNGETIEIDIGDGLKMTVPAGNLRDYPTAETLDKVSRATKSPSPNGYVMDPRLLAEVQEVNNATVDHPERGIRILSWGGADDKGQRLEAMTMENAAGVRFVIMPMRKL